MRVPLKPHADTPPKGIHAVEVEIVMTDPDDILLRYFVDGSGLSLPEWKSPARADELWGTTCFELFLAEAADSAYYEFNFSPSSQWAAYAFTGYREGRRDLPLAVAPFVDRFPTLGPEDGTPHYALDADVDLADMPRRRLRMGLSAVIEEAGRHQILLGARASAGKARFPPSGLLYA